MPQVIDKRPRWTLLNNDGRPHPLENTLAVAALVLGLSALVLGYIPETHFFGALTGVIAFPLALYSQMISATIGERWLNVIAMIAAFVGTGFALRHGGFNP